MFDSVGTALAVEPIETPVPVDALRDPLAPRWYLNTVERNAMVEGHECGFATVRYAKWGVAQVFSVPEELHTTDDNPTLPKERIVQHTADDVQAILSFKFAGRDLHGNLVDNKVNKGMVFGFFGETDAAKMEVISDTLLPTLPKIREIVAQMGAESVFPAVCDGQDDLDFGERQTCPTCWLKWLESDVCTQYLQSVATNGREVFSANNTSQMWVVKPLLAELDLARELTIESLKTGLKYLQDTWRQIVAEIETGKRNGLDEGNFQHTIRKDLHQVKPEQREMMLIKEASKANQGNGSVERAIEMLAQSQAQTNALLAQVLAGGLPPVAPTTQGESQLPDEPTLDEPVIKRGPGRPPVAR